MDEEETLDGGAGGTATAEAPGGGTPGARTAENVQDRTAQSDAKQIAALARAHGLTGELAGWLERGLSAAQVKEEILATRAKETPALPDAPSNRLDLTEKEKKRYSLARALLAAHDNDWRKAGFERECSATLATQLHKEADREARGVCIPTEALEIRRAFDVNALGLQLPGTARLEARAALVSTTATAGAEFVFTKAGSFIEMLRAIAQVLKLGATVLPGLRGNLSLPKQTGGAAAEWIAENPGADVTETNLATALVTLSPKTLMATVAATRQMLAQAVENVALEDLLRRDLAIAHALGIDAAAIKGTGAANQPTGVLTKTGVNLVDLGANGLAPTWPKIVELETAIAEDNAEIGEQKILTTPGMRGQLKTTQKFAGTNGDPIWQGTEVNGYQAAVSTQVPSNLADGTGTNLHAIIQGVWEHLFVGEWGMLDIVVDPYAKKKRAIIEMTSFQMADIQFRYPECFAVIKDAIRS